MKFKNLNIQYSNKNKKMCVMNFFTFFLICSSSEKNSTFHLFSNNMNFYNNGSSSNTSISFGVRNSRFKNRK